MTAGERPWVVAAALSTAAAVVLGAGVAPADAVQGNAQRLMYLHVPVAWCAYACFLAVLVGSVWYLATRRAAADRVARAAAEAGVVLTALTLVTGALWGRLIWGTWWVWDARVITTTAMGLVYVGYLACRAAAGGPRAGRPGAVIGVAGFAVVPLVHFSVLWWRTLHQPPTVLAPDLTPPLHPLMAAALAAAVVAAGVLTAWTLRCRVRASARAEAPVAAPPGSMADSPPGARHRPLESALS